MEEPSKFADCAWASKHVHVLTVEDNTTYCSVGSPIYSRDEKSGSVLFRLLSISY